MPTGNDLLIRVLAYGTNDLSLVGEGLTYDGIKSGIQAFGYNVETFEQHEKISKIISEILFIRMESVVAGNTIYHRNLTFIF